MDNMGFLRNLSQYLFWEYNVDMLDPDIDKKLIMERVFTRGTENDEKEIFNYYGKEIIKNTVPEIKYLDKKTLNYLSVILDISKEQFKCYRKSLSGSPFGIS
jgi:adenylate kinase family enzyme